MKRLVLLLAALAALGTPALGSEESEALSARGLVETGAGRPQAALDYFNRAVAADPGDPIARFHRGATRAKLGQYGGAADDLRAAIAAKPDFPEAALELGAALIETRQYAEAVQWLQVAQQRADLDAQASFFLGVAQLRLDRLDDARQSLARARAGDPSLDLPVQYYEGVVAYRANDLGRAEGHFAAVRRAAPDAPLGREAAEFLEVLHRSARAAYEVFGAAAFEYDSNVTLAGDLAPGQTVPAGISQEADGRFVLNVGGTYVPWSRGHVSLVTSYEFFQSLHFRLTDFNLQDHRPAVQLVADYDLIYFGLLGRYDYYLLSTDSFMQEATAFPWVAVREKGIGRTELYYRMQRRDYKDLSFAVLNGFYHAVGWRQVLDLGDPERKLWFGYQLDLASPVGSGSDTFQYGAHQLEAGVRWVLPYRVTGETSYRYEHQQYAAASGVYPPAGGRRKDNDHRVVVALERPLTDHLVLVGAYFGTFNDSNKPDFNYDRHIGSIGMEVRF